jgi:hypothetical protein
MKVRETKSYDEDLATLWWGVGWRERSWRMLIWEGLDAIKGKKVEIKWGFGQMFEYILCTNVC